MDACIVSALDRADAHSPELSPSLLQVWSAALIDELSDDCWPARSALACSSWAAS